MIAAITTGAVPAELDKAVAETGLAADGVMSLKNAFAPHFIEFHALADDAKAITVGQPKAARDMRLALKAIRVGAEKTRKAMKAESLLRGKAIDGVNALLVYQLTPLEKAMDDIEKAEEIAEAKRKAALQEARAEDLAPYADPSFYDLGAMPDDQWDQLLSGAKAAHEAKIAAEKKAEADRIEAERVAAEAEAKRQAEAAAERERMRAENERLAKIAAQERKAREAAEATARKEREALEATAKAEREEAARLARIEREKREVIEAENAHRAAVEATRIAIEKAAAKKAAAAPDKKKIKEFAAQLRGLPMPGLKTEAGQELATTITEQIAKFAAWLDKKAEAL
jgi:hypothetical protein